MVTGYASRSYITSMRLWKDDPAEVTVRVFRACEGAKFLEGDSFFRPHEPRFIQPKIADLGEQLFPDETTWDEGQNPLNYDGQKFVGSLEAWRTGGVHGVDEPVPLLDDGSPVFSNAHAAPGKPLVSWRPHRDGWILLMGSASFWRWNDGTGDTFDTNPVFRAAIRRWSERGTFGNAIGTAGPLESWSLDPFMSGVGDIGTDGLDYTQPKNVQKFLDKLAKISVYLIGWNFWKGSTVPFFPAAALAYWTMNWVKRGGRLVVFGAPSGWYDPNEFNPNTFLAAMPTKLRLTYDSIGNRASGVMKLKPASAVAIPDKDDYTWKAVGFVRELDGNYTFPDPSTSFNPRHPKIAVSFIAGRIPETAVAIGFEFVTTGKESGGLRMTITGEFRKTERSALQNWGTSGLDEKFWGGPTDLWGGPATSSLGINDKTFTFILGWHVDALSTASPLLDFVEMRIYWKDASGMIPTAQAACLNKCHPMAEPPEPFLPITELFWANSCHVTGGNVLATDCGVVPPNPPPVGNPIMADEAVGLGRVIVFGGRYLLAGIDFDGNPYADWNTELKDGLARFFGDKLRASCGPSGRWAISPIYAVAGDVGSAAGSYTSADIPAFLAQLNDYGVLWCGISPVSGYSLSDYLHKALWPAVLTWLKAGGILALVGTPDEDPTAPYLLNALLAAMKTDMVLALSYGVAPFHRDHGNAVLTVFREFAGPFFPNALFNQDNTSVFFSGYNMLIDGTGYVYALPTGPVSGFYTFLPVNGVLLLNEPWLFFGPAWGGRMTVRFQLVSTQNINIKVTLNGTVQYNSTTAPGTYTITLGDPDNNPLNLANGNNTILFEGGLTLDPACRVNFLEASAEVWSIGSGGLIYEGRVNPSADVVQGNIQPAACKVRYQRLSGVFPSPPETWDACTNSPLNAVVVCQDGPEIWFDADSEQIFDASPQTGESEETMDAAGVQYFSDLVTGDVEERVDAAGVQFFDDLVTGDVEERVDAAGLQAAGDLQTGSAQEDVDVDSEQYGSFVQTGSAQEDVDADSEQFGSFVQEGDVEEVVDADSEQDGPPVTTLTDGLVQYYKLDETSGTRADSTGTLALSESGSVVAVSGVVGNAAYFPDDSVARLDGSDQTITAGSFAVSLWVNLDVLDAFSSIDILTQIDGDFTNVYRIAYIDGDIFAQTTATTGVRWTATDAGVWIHVVFMQTASGHELWINGAMVDSDGGSLTLANAAGGVFSLNRFIFEHPSFAVDEAGVWDRELTPTEIAALYNGGAGITYPF